MDLIQNYSSDEETNAAENDLSSKEFKRQGHCFPIPQSILSLQGVTHHEEIIDNSEDHDGRIRSFKHERGNWASLIFIEYVPSYDLLMWMKNTLGKLNIDNVYLFDEFHVSLTKTLILKFHWIDSFAKEVKNIAETLKSFYMELTNLQVYCNQENTRTFLGIEVKTTNYSLQTLTNCIDELLKDYQLPVFYKDGSYHISFIWCLGNRKKILEEHLQFLSSNFSQFLINNPNQRSMYVDNIKCKIGNRTYTYRLK